MATDERRTATNLEAADWEAVKRAGVRRLVTALETAHRAGTLRPVDPNAKPVTMEIRVKADAPDS